ncbi:hypothetical protein SETIT_8G041400v2 [Setaria italica]|uniref:Uncharacterized protein n=2 Tax=Setaria TaxID=4554 RepID=K3ZLQ6_SETIT|nr:hypothetical protein SETIT_8G041400v2 [Setaria italica]TKV99395.1 hypothetical protein SEVIR_8G040600v2 [Setaria viridis]
MASHQRTSLPSKPFSTEAKGAKELQNFEACISSSCASIDTMCDGLKILGGIYTCIEEVISLPSNQTAVSMPQQRKMVKMIIQELQTCLEGGHDVSIQLKIVCFVHMKPEMAISLLESTSGLLPNNIVTTDASNWSFVSKRFRKGKRTMGDENGAEFLFRRLIQSRVYLLNILSASSF